MGLIKDDFDLEDYLEINDPNFEKFFAEKEKNNKIFNRIWEEQVKRNKKINSEIQEIAMKRLAGDYDY